MALDPHFMLAPSLEDYFVDKDTGLPLNGTASFYVDTSRTVPKNVFILTGSPPNYTYAPIGNVVQIANGTMVYGGTNVQVYYYPFSFLLPLTVELYYVVVQNSGGVTQFTREGWPNYTTDTPTPTPTDNNQLSYIPDGQFLAHINIPETSTSKAGEITAPITDIAYGGWTFEVPVGTSSVNNVSFQRLDSPSVSPTSYPRYELKMVCQIAAAGDGFKDARVKFKDVNKFSSTTGEQYTFYLEGVATSGTPSVSIVLIKNFGTGGSTPTEKTIATFNLTASYASYSAFFDFGSNIGQTIGLNDDDYIQLAIRYPATTESNISITNVALLKGAVAISSFPINTTRQNQYRAITPPVPSYSRNDLYLPIRLVKDGFEYDNSEIGDVVQESQISVYVSSLHPTTNRMLANGAQYETATYSPLGIPFSRLQAKYFNTTANVPIWGTGSNYFTASTNAANTSQLIITNNSFGSVTNAADVSTTFTINTIHTGATTYYTESYLVATDTFYIQNLELGKITTPISAGTSGFTVSVIQSGSIAGPALLPEISSVQTIIATTLAGKYFEFDSIHSTVNQPFYVWFKVDGAGTDPAIAGRVGIEVDLNITDTPPVVAEKIRESLNGWQVTTVNTVIASSIPVNSYFTINSTTQAYYVWYAIDGAGADPLISGKTAIRVDISSTDTSAQVATKTQIAINSKYFAAPDFRGLFLRGWDNNAGNDPDAATRYSLVPGILGDVIGTQQYSGNLSHLHPISTEALGNPGGGGNFVGGASTSTTNYAGGFESRPKNKNVNLVIKY